MISYLQVIGWPSPRPQEAIGMNAPNDNTAAKGLRGWWNLRRDPACSA